MIDYDSFSRCHLTDIFLRRRCFDSTNAAARTFSVGQCVAMVRDTSLLNKSVQWHFMITPNKHIKKELKDVLFAQNFRGIVLEMRDCRQ